MKKQLLRLALLFPAFTAFGQLENAQLYLPFDGFLADLAKGRTVTPHGSPLFSTNSKGQANKALLLNGTSQYLDVDTNFIKGASSYSVAVSFYPTHLTGYHYILNSGASNNNVGFSIGTYNSSGFAIYRTSTSTINNDAQSIPVVFEMDKWYHLVAVFSAPNSLNVYINGQSKGVFTGVSGSNAEAFSKLYIGVQGNASIGYFQGKLDELAVFNKALTTNEVAVLYQALVTDLSDRATASSLPCSQLVKSEANSLVAPMEASVIDLQGKSFSPTHIAEDKAHYTLNAGFYLVQDAVTQCKTKVIVP